MEQHKTNIIIPVLLLFFLFRIYIKGNRKCYIKQKKTTDLLPADWVLLHETDVAGSLIQSRSGSSCHGIKPMLSVSTTLVSMRDHFYVNLCINFNRWSLCFTDHHSRGSYVMRVNQSMFTISLSLESAVKRST